MIKLIVLDVDGTLTDGKIIYDEHGNETKNFSVKDGLAIATWSKKLNLKVAIITGRKSQLVEKRAKELGITYLFQGIHNKLEIVEKICKDENITLKNVGAIGDDLNDLKMLKAVAISFAPNDACEYIKDIVTIKCKNNGGYGAVREMIEIICKNDNNYENFINVWL
jgi:3-deoxy-D-manno-octulosonate 8-phosphate phosphatase (KDO 8-P phosphatase)